MLRRTLLGMAGAVVVTAGLGTAAQAQEPVKIGLILPMTGPFASTGKQIEAAVKLFMQQNGDTVAGKKIELIVKDDTGAADVTKRIAQELVVNDKVQRPRRLRPDAAGARRRADRDAGQDADDRHGGRRPSIITEQSPYIVRTSFTAAAGDRADGRLGRQERHQEGRDAGLRLRPRHRRREGVQGDASPRPAARSSRNCACRSRNPDFAPFLQRVEDAKPGRGVRLRARRASARTFMKQFVERGLDKAGIKLIATGDVTDDDLLNDMGDAALGVITSHHYSAAHDSPENKAFVEAFKKANNGMRPNFMAVGGYDGMHLIYEALKKTNGATDGDDADRGDEGHELDEPARPDLDRSRDPRHRPEHLHPQGREGGRRALQRRVRHHPSRSRIR